MAKFLKDREAPVNPKLETTAEINLGKEINMVNEKDFNHLDLVIEAKNNRLKSEFFYIYNYDQFNNCSLLKPNFDIFAEEGALNHTSARYVIHYLTKELKNRFKEIDRASRAGRTTLYDVFKPSLGQFDDEDIAKANEFIRSMFPYEGCSYTGEKLEIIINKANWITLIIGLRLVWSLLPGAIIPWDSYNKFKEDERRSNYSNFQSFYQSLPIFLPSHNHCCVLFEFLEIFIAIFADDYFVDLNLSTDLIFTAGQICFNRDEFSEPVSQNDDDLSELQKFYYKRGSAFYHLFIAYLRSLSKEPNFEYKVLLDPFKIDEYPPKPYKPVTQKALTLTVPNDPDLTTTNYFKLISNAANATSRIYSSNHTFTKFENKFLDKFEVNPHKIIEHFFSKSSKNYLLKFDKALDFENFKVNSDVSELRKNLKNGTLFDNKELVSTFISDFSRYGFESQRDNGNNSETFIADTINFNFNSNLETVDNLPVRVSKLEISEWFINAWKYETFLGYLQNTVVLKLTKTIGDCDWLIITSHDKVSTTNRYLTPPSSTEEEADLKKHLELGGSLIDEEDELKDTHEKRSLLPALSTKNKPQKPIATPSTPRSSSIGSPRVQRKSPPRNDLKRISFPSAPKNIEIFEKDAAETKGEELIGAKGLSPQRRNVKRTQNDIASLKPLPAPIMPNQRITTPTQQSLDVQSSVPPAVVKDYLAADSMTSQQASFIASKIDFSTPKEIKYISPKHVRNSSSPKNVIRKPVLSGEKKLGSPQFSTPSATTEPKKEGPSAKVAEQYGVNPWTKSTGKLQSPLSVNTKEQVLTAPLTRSQSSLNEVVPRSPVFSEPPKTKASHPYQQLRESPPPQKQSSEEDAATIIASPIVSIANEDSPSVEPKAKADKKPSLGKPIVLEPAASHFQTPPSPVLDKPLNPLSSPVPADGSRFGKKLSLHTNFMSSSSSSSKSSPIAQALPRLFKKQSNKELPKMSTSDSSKSLAFINDGSGADPTEKSEKKSLFSSQPKKKENRPSILEANPELAVSPELIPEITYTPRALRNSASLTNSPKLEQQSTIIEEKPPKVTSDNRESFESDLSSTSNNQFDSVDSISDTTQDTTKNTISGGENKMSSDLDGLLEEIKESMDPLEAENFFSTDDLVRAKNAVESN